MSDLDDLFELEAAERSQEALRRLPGAGEALIEWLLRLALEATGKELRSEPVEAREVLALLGLSLRPNGGRRPKDGPGSRAEAAKRLRTLAALAAIAHAPRPMLEFYASAAAAIETGAEPLAALGLRARRGRPAAEGELARFAVDYLTEGAFRRARADGASRDDALEFAGAEIGSSTGRGRSAESVRRARRRLKRNPPNS